MYFLLLLLLAILTSINGSEEEMTYIGEAYEGFNPCDDFFLSMDRIIDGPAKSANYWNGIFYFEKWPNLKEYRIALTVDNKARIEFDEDDGAVTVNGKTFNINVWGHPKEFRFKLRGEPKGAFPNIERITLNDQDICKNPAKWEPSFLYNTNVGETEDDPKPIPTCGKRLVQHEGLITNGYPSKEGDWPWHAALYHVDNLEQKYKCGGTLINSNTLLTAAHCVYEFGRAIVPERVLAQLGKHNLQLSGPNTQEFQIHRITVHNNFTYNDLQNDIALLRLKTHATLNNYVQPICLWDINNAPIQNVINLEGMVVGWGLNERDQQSVILSQASMPVVSLTTCLQSNRDFFGLFLNDFTYCAGFRNGTSVCNGDSGGGMYFEQDGLYKIRGIVSLTVSRSDANICNPQQYVIFTDAAKYLDWISENSK